MANNIILPFSELQAELNDEAMIDPDAIIEITENGRYNVARYGYADVNVEGGGGETWQTVFEDSVTTEDTPRGIVATIEGYYISADNIKVTFNGTEYECPKISVESANVYGGFNESTQDFDFSEYPFAIMSATEGGSTFFKLYTETTGTYTLKIEEPQSGGSSDFSTATVTINWDASGPDAEILEDNCPMIYRDDSDEEAPYIQGLFGATTSPVVVEVPLYKGKCYWDLSHRGVTVTGNIEELYDGYLITGDCSITIGNK